MADPSSDNPIHRAIIDFREYRWDAAVPLLTQIASDQAGTHNSESVIAAHFLLGVEASRAYWSGVHADMDSSVPGSAHGQVIRHFTAFLDHPNRDQHLTVDDERNARLRILCDGEGRPHQLPALDGHWAVFPDHGADDWSRHPDDLVLALERRAMAHFACGRQLDAARDLVAAKARYPWLRMSSWLSGWIGWLLFNGGEYAEAAESLDHCYFYMEPDEERAERDGISPEEAKLKSWYDDVCGGYGGSKNHALMAIGHGENGLNPTQSLNGGSDGFLFRLGLSLLLAGREQEALPHLAACLTISPMWSDAKAVLDLAENDPAEAKRVAKVILEKFRSETEASRGG
jgi:tetratricopeptide (TPR) repeat protein